MKFQGAIFSILVGLLQNTRAQAQNYHLSCAPKNLRVPFFNRLATQEAQVLVTREALSQSTESLVLESLPATELLLVEHPSGLPLAGELGRICGIAAIRVPAYGLLAEFHDLGSYVEAIAPTEIHPLYPIIPSYIPDPDENRLSDYPIKIDEAFLREKLAIYSGVKPFTYQGTNVFIKERGSVEGRNLARAFLRMEYEALGFRVSQQNYDRRGAANLIAEKVGKLPGRTLIISAHLDSVENAGADDNGSGIISALTIAKSLSNREFNLSLQMLAFDEEEKGLLGSRAFVAALQENQEQEMSSVIGVYNLEMTGYDADNDGAFHVIDCDEYDSPRLSEYLLEAIATNNIALNRVKACTNRSDHASFWRYRIPAVVISQNFFGGDSNPCYHQTCDRIGKINFEYMSKITQALALTTSAILSSP